MRPEQDGGGAARHGTARRVMGRLAACAIVALVLAAGVESGSAFVLYYFHAIRQTSFQPAGLATVTLARTFAEHAFGVRLADAAVTVSSTPEPLFVVNRLLGYTIRPGDYTITFQRGSRQHQFSARIMPDGTRATSHARSLAKDGIYIFGDSFVWGWGNNDQQTLPWLLQDYFPNYHVLNFAQNGYGNTQSLLQLKDVSQGITVNDVVVFTYGSYYNIRNAAAPSWLRQFKAGGVYGNSAEVMRYPYATLRAGELAIDHVNLFCIDDDSRCAGSDPDAGYMHEVTEDIILSAFKATPAKFAVAFIQGDDGDPVIADLRQHAVPVIDIRPRPDRDEYDDFQPFDAHPGPLAQYHFAKKLAAGLVALGLKDRVQLSGVAS